MMIFHPFSLFSSNTQVCISSFRKIPARQADARSVACLPKSLNAVYPNSPPNVKSLLQLTAESRNFSSILCPPRPGGRKGLAISVLPRPTICLSLAALQPQHYPTYRHSPNTSTMPLIKIDLIKGRSKEEVKKLADVVQEVPSLAPWVCYELDRIGSGANPEIGLCGCRSCWTSSTPRRGIGTSRALYSPPSSLLASPSSSRMRIPTAASLDYSYTVLALRSNDSDPSVVSNRFDRPVLLPLRLFAADPDSSSHRYQIITQHEEGEIICEDTNLGFTRSSQLVFIQVRLSYPEPFIPRPSSGLLHGSRSDLSSFLSPFSSPFPSPPPFSPSHCSSRDAYRLSRR
jgi:hypothetical protein